MSVSNSRRGQTMVEYVLAFAALVAAVSALAYLVKAVRGSTVRTEHLIGSDYP